MVELERWANGGRELVLDCDPEVLTVVIDYMYGIDLPQLVVRKALETFGARKSLES